MAKIEIDQSGKIEKTEKNTVIAYANSNTRAVFLPRRLKRQVQEIFRLNGMHRIYIYFLFAYGVYRLIRNLNQPTNIIIDTEYPGRDKFITKMIFSLLKESPATKHQITFKQIGSHPRAHYAAHDVFSNKKSPDEIISLKEVTLAIKNAYGHLRECLSTLVDVQPRRIGYNVTKKLKKVKRRGG